MLKLPKCPYCGYKFDYKGSANSLKQKQVQCRKCKKLMSVSYKFATVIMAVIFFVVLIVLNTLYLSVSKSQTVIPNLVFTVALIVVYLVFIPLKVKFGKIAGQEDPPEKLKKNRHRHKKTKNQSIEFDENPLKGTSFDK